MVLLRSRREIVRAKVAAHRPQSYQLRLEILEHRLLLSYAITDLGTLGGAQSVAWHLNAIGQVTGQADTAGGQTHAFRWKSGVMTDLGTLGGAGSLGYGINDAGVVVGPALPAGSGNYHAFLVSARGIMKDLGTLGDSDSVGHDINKSSQVVGWSTDNGSSGRPFLWKNGIMTARAPLPGYSTSGEAWAINDAGQAVGYSRSNSGNARAVRWQGGVPTDLGALPGAAESWGRGINPAGQVVGWSGSSSGNFRAFLWTNGVMQDLTVLPGAPKSVGYDVNAAGQAVGWSGTGSLAGNRAFVWHGGVMTDLNTQIAAGSGWVLYEAYSINTAGQIVGVGTINGKTLGYLLTPEASPIPTPGLTLAHPKPAQGSAQQDLPGPTNPQSQPAMPRATLDSPAEATTAPSRAVAWFRLMHMSTNRTEWWEGFDVAADLGLIAC